MNSILIIEDEQVSIHALASILIQDYVVYIEKNSMKAVETAKKLAPDLILLDVLMPELNGFDIIVKLKNADETRDIPVIFVTGLSSHSDESKGLMRGAVDYIHKPYNPSIVKMRVRHQMKIINLVNKLEKLSNNDPLTGIGNRRYFYTVLKEEWRRAIRDKTPLGLIIFDIDNFKVVNDTFGHPVGDYVLINTTQIIQSVVKRTTDKMARWGGEEFVLIQPNTSEQGVLNVAEKIRGTIADTPIDIDDTRSLKITVSIGANSVIPLFDDDYSMDDFFSDADEALLKAKLQGKNRVCFPDRTKDNKDTEVT